MSGRAKAARIDSVAAPRLLHPCGAAPASLSVSAPPRGFGWMVPLPEAALALLGQWYRHHRHPRFLFPAMGHSWNSTLRPDPLEQARIQREQWQRADHPVSTSALQNVWRIALAASGVAKPATIHTLRHSYATHLLEEGVSLRYVSAYLGHASLEQTLVYAHLTAVSEAQTQEAVARMAAGLARPTLPPIAPPAR